MTKNKLSRKAAASGFEDDHGVCDACGLRSHFEFSEVIGDSLAAEWRIDTTQKKVINCRESMNCLYCGCSLRLRLLARALQFTVDGGADGGLEHSIQTGRYDNLAIAEINSCGVLHTILKRIPGLSYSEYASDDPLIAHQDLTALTYADESFDIVLTSDVLEHVPDPLAALKETYRVLRAGGVHIMTVPLLKDRKTITRTRLSDDGGIEHVLDESFHGSGEKDYLVWSEFGGDFIDICREAGFEAYHLFDDATSTSVSSGVVLAVKPGMHQTLKADVSALDSVENEKNPISDARIAEVAKKIQLTLDHANNLQDLLDAYRDEEKKKSDYIKHLESRGIRYHLKQALSSLRGPRPRQ